MNDKDLLPEPLLTAPQLAAWLQIKESTIRKRVCYRKIPFVAIGRSIRFRKEDIEKWLRLDNQTSTEPAIIPERGRFG